MTLGHWQATLLHEYAAAFSRIRCILQYLEMYNKESVSAIVAGISISFFQNGTDLTGKTVFLDRMSS